MSSTPLDTVSCPPTLSLKKTRHSSTRRFLESCKIKSAPPLLPAISESEVISSQNTHLQSFNQGNAKQRKMMAFDEVSSIYTLESVNTYNSGISSLYSKGNNSLQSKNSGRSINTSNTFFSASTYATMASYTPTRRQATLGPIILVIMLFSALTVNHVQEHHEQMARLMARARGKGIKPIPINPNAKPSMLRGALGAIYLTQDYERRSDYAPVNNMAHVFSTPDGEPSDPCRKEFQTTTKDGTKVVGIMILPNCTSSLIGQGSDWEVSDGGENGE